MVSLDMEPDRSSVGNGRSDPSAILVVNVESWLV